MKNNSYIKNLSILNNHLQKNHVKQNNTNKINNTNINQKINNINYDKLFNTIINDNDNLTIKNKFIHNLNKYNNLNNDDLPTINNILYLYSSQVKENFQNDSQGFYFYTNFIIRLIQLFEFLFIAFGWCLPYNLLKYHIFLCVFNLIIWEMFKNKDFFNIFIKNKNKKYTQFIPINQNFCLYYIIFVMFLSLYSLVFTDNTIFSYIFSFIKYLAKYSYNN
jgi:hypothetical protein